MADGNCPELDELEEELEDELEEELLEDELCAIPPEEQTSLIASIPAYGIPKTSIFTADTNAFVNGLLITRSLLLQLVVYG